MLTKKIATVVAAAGALATATPAAVARPAQNTRSAGSSAPAVRIIIECPDWGCGSNHNRRMIRQR